MTEVNLIDETLKGTYKDYYPEISKDTDLFANIKKSKAEVFFIRLCAMQDKMQTDFSYDLAKTKIDRRRIEDSVMHQDEAIRYPDMLTSAADMLHIFDTVIVSADKELVDAMMSGDDAKIIAAYESPLCQNASMFVSNEATIERKDDIADIRKGGANMNTLNAIIDNSPEIQNMLGNMRAQANIKYAAAGLSSGYTHPTGSEMTQEKTTRNQEIATFIDVYPKTVLALALIAEQRQALGLPAEKIDSVAALEARCAKSDVRDVAKSLKYSDLEASLGAATRKAERYASIEKTSRGNNRTA